MELLWIPVVIVAVWILVNLARGFEATRKDPFRRPEQRPRPSSGDIDRFLQEVQQRRMQQQRQQRQPGTPRPVEPIPTAQPVVRPVVVEADVIVPAEVVEPVLDVLPAERPRLAGRAPQLPTAPLKVAPPVVLAATAETPSPHLAELRRLLKSGTGIRAAFMLQEVLGPPRCRRPQVRAV